MITIATWNVNSIKARLPHVLRWLHEFAPDIALLQETKTTDDAFPRMEIETAGYHVQTHGQKTYNGVAVLSKGKIEVAQEGLPGDVDDRQARYLEVDTLGIRAACIYLPNGNPTPGDKYDYKLRWMDRLHVRARELLKTEKPFVLGGDYNVIPDEGDVYDPKGWRDDALFRLQSRKAFRRIAALGLIDAFRALNPEIGRYTWWDYRGGGWQKDMGVRIDHLLLSPQAADRLDACEIDRAPRGWEKPSDHTPVWCRLDD